MPKPSTYSQVDTYSLMPDTGPVDTYSMVPDTGPVDTYGLVQDTGGSSPDDWESMLESGQLDQSLDRLSLYSQPKPRVKILTDDCRTQYKPPEPKLTILKRPTTQPVTNGQARQKAPTKTLEQREADYAQARQRILGKDVNNQQAKVKVSVKQKQSQAGGNSAKNQGVNSRDGVVVGASRNPRGSDGTKGFSGRQQNQSSVQQQNQTSGRQQNQTSVQQQNQTSGRQQTQSSVQQQNQTSGRQQNQTSVQQQNQTSGRQQTQNQPSGRHQNQPSSSR